MRMAVFVALLGVSKHGAHSRRPKAFCGRPQNESGRVAPPVKVDLPVVWRVAPHGCRVCGALLHKLGPAGQQGAQGIAPVAASVFFVPRQLGGRFS